MRLRLEQSLREGSVAILISVWILPFWLMGASVHRAHWAKFVADLGWSEFLLGWGGLVWSVVVGALLVFWSAFSFLEAERRVARLWTRCISGSIILLSCAVLSVPGWVWLAEISGASGFTAAGTAIRSLLVPLGALLIANLQASVLPNYAVAISSILLTSLLTGVVWTELL